MIFNGLVKYDKDINLVGDLAENWEIQDEGLTIIFHLRKGVFWHDSQPFTAADVEWTYQKLIDPAVPTPYSGDFIKVKSLQVIDPHTVKVSYGEPFAPGLASWGMPIMPKHIWENISPQNFLLTNYNLRPVGSGPYKLRGLKQDSANKIISVNLAMFKESNIIW